MFDQIDENGREMFENEKTAAHMLYFLHRMLYLMIVGVYAHSN